MYLLISANALASLLLASIVNVNLQCGHAYKVVSHPKGKSYMYSYDNDYGKRIVANQQQKQQSNSVKDHSGGGGQQLQQPVIEQPDYHQEDGQKHDSNADYSSHEEADPRSHYNPQYSQDSAITRFGASGKYSDRSQKSAGVYQIQSQIDPSSAQYPSMLSQIANAVYGDNQQLAHATPSPRQLTTERSPSHYMEYMHTGPSTATTPRTITEAPDKDYLSRPMYEYITPKPQAASGGAMKYETSIESPPPTGRATSFQKMVMYHYPKSAVESSSAMPDVPVHNVHNGPPPSLTPSSTSDNQNQYYDHEFKIEMTAQPEMDYHHSAPRPPPRVEYQAAEPLQHPPKYNPVNSVKAGPNSFMTLSFEPVKKLQEEAARYSTAPTPASYQKLAPRSLNSFNNPSHQPVYRTQTSHSLEPVSSIEDQQESPMHQSAIKFNYGDTYARPGLHQPPITSTSLQQKPQHQSKATVQTYSYQGQQSQPQHQPEMSSHSQHAPEWHQQQQSQPEPAQQPTHYKSYQRKKLQSPASLYQNQPEQYYIPPPQHPNYQFLGSASEVEPVEQEHFDWASSVQNYAKEFGFEMPSANVAPKKATRVSQPNVAKPNHREVLLSAPVNDHSHNSRKSNSSSSSYYFNIGFAEFANDSPEPKHQQQHLKAYSSRPERFFNSRVRLSYEPSSLVGIPGQSENLFSESSPNVKTDQLEDKEISEAIAFAKNIVLLSNSPADNTATGDKSTTEKITDNASAGQAKEDKITKEEVDAILQKYNEVISHKQKAAAVVAAKENDAAATE